MTKPFKDQNYQAFILASKDRDPREIALAKSRVEGFSSAELAQAIKGYQTIRKKVPLWYSCNDLLFPPSLNLEQSSSEITALFKRDLVKTGDSAVDLTGGLGVDTFFLSEKFKHFTHVDLNADLSRIVSHNFHVLGKESIGFKVEDGIEYLKNSQSPYDLVYLDPSRRDKDKKRVYKLEDCLPNIIENWSLLKQNSKQLLIKNAPLVDIKSSLDQLKNHMRVIVLAVRNEVKEVLFYLDKDMDQTRIEANNYNGVFWENFSFSIEEEKSAIPEFSEALNYLYLPNSAILKAGGFNIFAKYFDLKKLHPNSHLYTSDMLHKDLPARVFRIDQNLSLNKKNIKKSLPDGKAHIIARNFPMTADQIRKKIKCVSSGNRYIIASTQGQDKPVSFLTTLL